MDITKTFFVYFEVQNVNASSSRLYINMDVLKRKNA